ncbi:MAG TPA: VOC family protein [Segetibacter sp.]|jgi:extradiol dioxygenase family protein
MFKHTKAFSGFSVDDLQKAKTFYSETLGVNVTNNPMGIIELNFIGRNNVIVYPKTNHIPATYTILNFPVINIEEAVNTLTSKGVYFEQYSGGIQTDEKGICRNEGHSIAWFKDPAGNILSVIEETSNS